MKYASKPQITLMYNTWFILLFCSNQWVFIFFYLWEFCRFLSERWHSIPYLHANLLQLLKSWFFELSMLSYYHVKLFCFKNDIEMEKSQNIQIKKLQYIHSFFSNHAIRSFWQIERLTLSVIFWYWKSLFIFKYE